MKRPKYCHTKILKMQSSILQLLQRRLMDNKKNKKNNSTHHLREREYRIMLSTAEKIMFREGGEFPCTVSVRLFKGIWILACITLCGATGAHRSELHYLQAHQAIHRGDRNTCIQTCYTHIHMLVCIHGYIHIDVHTHSYCIYMCSLQQ